jgi:amino acid transporter
MYGIPFVILGNLAGNAIAFGMYFMDLLGYPNAGKGPIIGAAVTVLTVSVLIHMFSRRGGIMLNNSFAIIKVFILLTIIVLGFIKASGNRLGGDERATDNFNPNISFSTDRKGIAALPDYVTSLLYVTYTYSGFEQPFYALTECANPRKMFPWATMTAMALATFLFVLVNIAYLCAVPKDVQLANIDETMATIFFQRMFGDSREAQRGMAALAAFSIFGNLIVMTFTASRVKQEIAKEGILPFSLFFASSSTSLWARFQSRFLSTQEGQDSDHPEQTPIAALGLHLLTSCLLIAVTSMLDPSDAYSILVPLYSYVMVIMVAFFVSAGLLYLKFSPLPTSAEGQQDSARMEWSQRSEEDRFRPWLDPVPTIICFVVCGFLLFASFDKLSDSSPFANTQGKIPWYLVPTVGFSTLLGGFIWWLGLKLRMAQRKETLVVDRVPWIEQEDPDTDFWIQKGEFVRHHWRPN